MDPLPGRRPCGCPDTAAEALPGIWSRASGREPTGGGRYLPATGRRGGLLRVTTAWVVVVLLFAVTGAARRAPQAVPLGLPGQVHRGDCRHPMNVFLRERSHFSIHRDHDVVVMTVPFVGACHAPQRRWQGTGAHSAARGRRPGARAPDVRDMRFCVAAGRAVSVATD